MKRDNPRLSSFSGAGKGTALSMVLSSLIESGIYWQYSRNLSQSPCTLYRGSPHNADFGTWKNKNKICVSGTVGVPVITWNSLTYMWISQIRIKWGQCYCFLCKSGTLYVIVLQFIGYWFQERTWTHNEEVETCQWSSHRTSPIFCQRTGSIFRMPLAVLWEQDQTNLTFSQMNKSFWRKIF